MADHKSALGPADATVGELRAWLAAIVDSSDDAIVGKTLDGIITSWNRGAENLFGYSAAEAVGQHIFLIIPDDRRLEEADVLARLRRGEKIDHFETVRRTKAGREVRISLTVSPIKDDHGHLVGASKVARDITERTEAEVTLRQAHEELTRAHEQVEKRILERTAELTRTNEALRIEIAERHRNEQERIRLMAHLVVAQEDERRRIARELHDQLGQHMTGLRLTLETLNTQAVGQNEFRAQVETLQELARQLDRDIAFRVWELRPIALEHVGLRAALTNAVHHWAEHFGIRVRLHMGHVTDGCVSSSVETVMYRLAQEALNNVVKHARAGQVDVVLERTTDCLSLIIEDDGIGFDPSDADAVRDGLGLTGMRERAALVGADLQIESTSGGGTTILVRVPLAAPSIESA
jgi:two-component system sensor histidine kinase UhpB